jgi:hypothetical protein
VNSRVRTKVISAVDCATLATSLGIVGSASPDADSSDAQSAAVVEAVTGTSDVIPASSAHPRQRQRRHPIIPGGTVDVPRDPADGVTLTTSNGRMVG